MSDHQLAVVLSVYVCTCVCPFYAVMLCCIAQLSQCIHVDVPESGQEGEPE